MDIRQTIDDWFQRHFSHVTPGTPDHAVLTAAKEALKNVLQPVETAEDVAEDPNNATA